ncbi:MAG: hypothetical protein ACLPN1_13240 [Dissulfurispiraceae bacterium]|jgi:hypothetical protein
MIPTVLIFGLVVSFMSLLIMKRLAVCEKSEIATYGGNCQGGNGIRTFY